MFGYVLPRKDKLSEENYEQYRAAYCGLCRSLKLHYGFRARFLVNYDMTFLYFLLRGKDQAQPHHCFCPARIFCKKNCLPDDEVMYYAADMSVLLSYWKLRDVKSDGGFFKRIAASVGLWFCRKPYRKAAKRHEAENTVFETQLQALQRLEAKACASIDRPADTFAKLLGACAGFVSEEKTRRIVELLLYHVGRYLYLVDALEDLPRDEKKGSYNPLRYRYALADGRLSEQDKLQFLDTVEASISLAASALELLDTKDEILTNIIYYGLPAVLHSVANGSFRKRGKQDEGSI